MFFLSFASAQLTYELEQETDLKVICLNEGYCSAAAYCNINIEYPNSSMLITNQNMTNQNSFHNYTITPGVMGIYKINGYCVDGAYTKEIDYNFQVTRTGTELTVSKSILYVMMISFLLFIFLLLLFILNNLPRDVRNDEGYVLEVSKLAYLRPIVRGLAWIILTATVFLLANLAVGFLETGMFGEFLFAIYTVMFISNFVIIPLCVIFMIQRIALSKEMMGLIERGVDFK